MVNDLENMKEIHQLLYYASEHVMNVIKLALAKDVPLDNIFKGGDLIAKDLINLKSMIERVERTI